MESTFKSPLLAGDDVVGTALDGLPLDDLLAHRELARIAITRLTGEHMRPGLSAPHRIAIKRLLERLDAHMAHLCELIEDKQVEEAWASDEAARLDAERSPGRARLR